MTSKIQWTDESWLSRKTKQWEDDPEYLKEKILLLEGEIKALKRALEDKN